MKLSNILRHLSVHPKIFHSFPKVHLNCVPVLHSVTGYIKGHTFKFLNLAGDPHKLHDL